ncbi:MAG: DASS family sodium-coupled anion symporter, partial [Candidatus Caldarchaeum sp.]
DPLQHHVAAIFGFAIVLWITEVIPVPVTALFSTVLLVLFGVTSPQRAFSSYGSPIIMLFIGSFLLAKAMQVHGLDRRISLWLLRKPFATQNAGRTMLAMGGTATCVSLFVSNTATCATMLPVALNVLRAMNADHGRFATGFLLMLTWSSSIAVGTIVSTPPNLIGLRLITTSTDARIGFLDWSFFAMPITVTMLFVAWVVLRSLFGKEAPDPQGARKFALEESASLGKMHAGEIYTVGAFCLAVGLWVLPGILLLVLGESNEFARVVDERLQPGVAALLATSLLFVLPMKKADQPHPLTWRQAATIDWGTILLFGGGIALGQVVVDTKLAEKIGEGLVAWTGADSLWEITALSALLSLFLSELASNTASATAIVPVAIGLAQAAGVNPVPPALGAALGASFGFMLPISTAPNAIVYGTGLVRPLSMIRAGFIFDVLGILCVLLWLRIILPLMGLA